MAMPPPSDRRDPHLVDIQQNPDVPSSVKAPAEIEAASGVALFDVRWIPQKQPGRPDG